MSKSTCEIFFWQRIITPHMAVLASTFAERGWPVTYVANREMSPERAAQGWMPPPLGAVNLELAATAAQVKALVQSAPQGSIHLCQGLRGNGLVAIAQNALHRRRLRQWVVMEMVDDSGWRGVIKRAAYAGLARKQKDHLEGVLAIGSRTKSWLQLRGFTAEQLFSFAYFLQTPDTGLGAEGTQDIGNRPNVRVLFVGQLIERKRVDLLIAALAAFNHPQLELWVVGNGPLESALRAQAVRELPHRVHWLGQQPMSAVPGIMAKADCLVLPSRYDGWGAVISEALMVGTPAICSDACGAAEVVRASGVGGVFRAGNHRDLVAELRRVLAEAPWPLVKRRKLAAWAQCLSARVGARYLEQILAYRAGDCERPTAPWNWNHGV